MFIVYTKMITNVIFNVNKRGVLLVNNKYFYLHKQKILDKCKICYSLKINLLHFLKNICKQLILVTL